jgi:hypothetical protein
MLDGNQMGILTPSAATFADPFDQFNLRILKLENRLQRERVARLKAEEIAEKGLRDLYEKQQQLALLETIATAANQSNSIDDTMRFALDAICQHTGWGFGNVYLPSATIPDYLVPAGVWHAANPAHLDAFISLTLETDFAIGQGLPGRVYQSGKPVWISDLTLDRNFPRTVVAALSGCCRVRISSAGRQRRARRIGIFSSQHGQPRQSVPGRARANRHPAWPRRRTPPRRTETDARCDA